MELFKTRRKGDWLRHTIWHPDAIGVDEWKYRSLKRWWLPLYDLIAVLAGVWAFLYGSPILHRLFPAEYIVDVVGLVFAFVALVCLVAVVMPKLYKVEIVGKIVLVALLLSYAAAIVIFNAQGDITSWFVAFVVLLSIPLPMFRLGLLGEEIKERREE